MDKRLGTGMLHGPNKMPANAETVLCLKKHDGMAEWLLKDSAAVDFYAGDTDKVRAEVRGFLDRYRKKRGPELYTDLLLALTHQYYRPAEAEKTWHDILVHKYYLSKTLGRNPGVRVAALDYLDNYLKQGANLRLLPEKDLDSLLLFVNTDGLTGVYNHRFFQEQLRRELGRAKRYRHELSLLMLDLDHFKTYNDHLGHRYGDLLLKEIGKYFESVRRESDTVARYGGDEFAIILPETNDADAALYARRLKKSFEEKNFGQGEKWTGPRLTLSVGLAVYPRDADTAEKLIEISDQRLYRAKRTGRNRIVHLVQRRTAVRAKRSSTPGAKSHAQNHIAPVQ